MVGISRLHLLLFTLCLLLVTVSGEPGGFVCNTQGPLYHVSTCQKDCPAYCYSGTKCDGRVCNVPPLCSYVNSYISRCVCRRMCY